LSAVPDVQGAGWIGGDEFDYDAPALAAPRPPVTLAFGKDGFHDMLLRGGPHTKIDEPRPCDLGTIQPVGSWKRLYQLESELARVSLQDARELHCRRT
jgi:hypothetical protein